MNAPVYQNQPTKPPDVEEVGRAWRLTWETTKPEEQAAIACWLVDTTGYGHPLWPWYFVCVFHLRPIEGCHPPHLRDPEFTHEVCFLAMNPGEPLPEVDMWSHPLTPHYMMPPDLEWQFTVRHDEQAGELAEVIVQAICEGHSPDVDYALWWGECIRQSAEHLCYGGHPSWN